MSIRSDYDPEAEHIKEVFASIEKKLGSLWFLAKDEQALITRMNLLMLRDEEKCYALDQYRRIKHELRKERERERAVEIERRKDKRMLIFLVSVAVLLVLLLSLTKLLTR